MDLSLFDYNYPPELIAQHPLTERDTSRLLVVDRKQGTWEHRRFQDFPDYFSKSDLLVFNNTKVFPARLYGRTANKRSVEILLLPERLVAQGNVIDAGVLVAPRQNVSASTGPAASEWSCLVKPARKLSDGDTITFSETLSGTLHSKRDDWSISFEDAEQFQRELPTLGLPPLPPYIKRERSEKEDEERYQTIYAEKVGAAAAPTAGFHFTESILKKLRHQGCSLCYGTLHIGRDTFEPVRVQNIAEHRMHGEKFEIPTETAQQVTKGKKEGEAITAIGTTTVRMLESAWNENHLTTGPEMTTAFFYPGYSFRVIDRLLTNFHQPKSTLLMLVAAFAGRELILEAYRSAIIERYRLFSYGDAMLIL